MIGEAILLEQNRRLREENDELRETVRQLRENAVERATAPLPEGIGRVTPLEERALRALLARPDLATKEFIYRALYPSDDHVQLKIVDVMVCHLRRKLPPTIVIETVWGRGYRVHLVKEELTSPMQASASVTSEAAAA